MERERKETQQMQNLQKGRGGEGECQTGEACLPPPSLHAKKGPHSWNHSTVAYFAHRLATLVVE